jgi:hypothetical protein
MKATTLTVVSLAAGFTACTNQPQYVPCAPDGAAPMDSCTLTPDMPNDEGQLVALGSLHVPVKPEADWKTSDRNKRMELQREVDRVAAGVEVAIYRLEHYDLSVEWTVTNLDDLPGEFFVDMNGANEELAYDPSMITRADPDDPPPPPLAGHIPYHIDPGASIDGVFREDQLVEAAIDLDAITRGQVNPFAALLTVSREADSFQPVSPYDPVTETGGEPTGPAVPRAAFRQLIRVDIAFLPDRPMRLVYNLRLREHVEIIHEEGLNAPDDELDIRDPAPYAASIP